MLYYNSISMAFLAGAMFPELILGAEEGLGAIVSGISTEFVSKAKQTVATTIASELADIANKNPDGITNLTLNEAIKRRKHRISHPKKLGRKSKRV
jgi:hypothetical protein